MIVDRERIVEEDHQTVAREVLERPFIGGDEIADRSVVVAEDVQQLFGAAVSAKAVKPRKSQKRHEM